MADIAGEFFPLDYESGTLYKGIPGEFFPLDYESGTLYKGIPGEFKFYDAPPCPPCPILHYRMRAWNLTTVDWEVWTSSGAPDVTPPSGNPVTGITVVGIWEA